MLIGCIALAGLPPFAGFFSKDEIIGAAWEHSKVLALLLLFTAFLTAYYTFRLYFRVFEGPELIPPDPGLDIDHALDISGVPHLADDAADEHKDGAAHGGHGGGHHHNHEPAVMIFPLVVLAVGAMLAGFFNWPAEHLGDFLGHSPSFALSYDTAEHRYAGTIEVNPVTFGQPTPAPPRCARPSTRRTSRSWSSACWSPPRACCWRISST
jgi:NAD(P)H-quinone oxidoreductase subunit 5